MSGGNTTKATGYRKSLRSNDPEFLTDIELPRPIAAGRDLLVKIKAVAVNPVDYKIRQKIAPKGSARGIVHAVEITLADQAAIV